MEDRFELWTLSEDDLDIHDDYVESFPSLKAAQEYIKDYSDNENDTVSYAIIEKVLIGKSIVAKTRKWEKA